MSSQTTHPPKSLWCKDFISVGNYWTIPNSGPWIGNFNVSHSHSFSSSNAKFVCFEKFRNEPFLELIPLFWCILAINFLRIQAQNAQFHTHYSFKMQTVNGLIVPMKNYTSGFCLFHPYVNTLLPNTKSYISGFPKELSIIQSLRKFVPSVWWPSVSIPTPWPGAPTHGQLVSILFLVYYCSKRSWFDFTFNSPVIVQPNNW